METVVLRVIWTVRAWLKTSQRRILVGGLEIILSIFW